MRILLALLVGLALSGCGPADPNVKNARQRLDDGEIIEFTKDGFREASCRDRKDTLLEIDEEQRRNIVLGDQQSFINVFRHTCFEVGSEIGFKKTDKNKRVTVLPGRIKIKKILWA